jgi:hypothetical protein
MDEPVAAQVAMEHGRDYRRHFPRMGRSPELEIEAPAFAVAFAGPLDLPHFGGVPPLGQPAIRRSAESVGVVCVVVNGSPTYYTDVDISGVN